MSKIVVGDPHDPDTDLGPLVSMVHRDKVAGMVARARGRVARIVTGGGYPICPALFPADVGRRCGEDSRSTATRSSDRYSP